MQTENEGKCLWEEVFLEHTESGRWKEESLVVKQEDYGKCTAWGQDANKFCRKLKMRIMWMLMQCSGFFILWWWQLKQLTVFLTSHYASSRSKYELGQVNFSFIHSFMTPWWKTYCDHYYMTAIMIDVKCCKARYSLRVFTLNPIKSKRPSIIKHTILLCISKKKNTANCISDIVDYKTHLDFRNVKMWKKSVNVQQDSMTHPIEE